MKECLARAFRFTRLAFCLVPPAICCFVPALVVRAMIQLRLESGGANQAAPVRARRLIASEKSSLHAGTASSSNELPNEGNERDHEQEMNQTPRHVEYNEAQ
jgi:hypothetical protein